MNSPSGVYGGLYTTIGGCFDVLASHVSPAASKTIHTNYMCTLINSMFKVNISHKIVPESYSNNYSTLNYNLVFKDTKFKST